MIFGSVTLDHSAVHTHRDSYLLDHLTVVSVRRPLLPGAAGLAGAATGFTLAFGDLLHAAEALVIVGSALGMAGIAHQVGQLKLLSRDLRGSELSGVIWGRHAGLNRIRREIAAALDIKRSGGAR